MMSVSFPPMELGPGEVVNGGSFLSLPDDVQHGSNTCPQIPLTFLASLAVDLSMPASFLITHCPQIREL